MEAKVYCTSCHFSDSDNRLERQESEHAELHETMTRTQGSGELDVASARCDSCLTCPLSRPVTPLASPDSHHDDESRLTSMRSAWLKGLVLLGPLL